jgi:hypothetical protein
MVSLRPIFCGAEPEQLCSPRLSCICLFSPLLVVSPSGSVRIAACGTGPSSYWGHVDVGLLGVVDPSTADQRVLRRSRAKGV